MIHRLHASPSCDSHVTVMSPRADEPRDELSAGIARHMAAVHAMAPDACITRSWRQHTATDTMCGRTFHGAARRHTGTPAAAAHSSDCLGLPARPRRLRRSSGRETDCRVTTLTTAAITSGRSGPWSLRATKVATDHCRPPHSSQTSTDITCAARCTHATVHRNSLMVPTPASCMCIFAVERPRVCCVGEFVNPSIHV